MSKRDKGTAGGSSENSDDDQPKKGELDPSELKVSGLVCSVESMLIESSDKCVGTGYFVSEIQIKCV